MPFKEHEQEEEVIYGPSVTLTDEGVKSWINCYLIWASLEINLFIHVLFWFLTG